MKKAQQFILSHEEFLNIRLSIEELCDVLDNHLEAYDELSSNVNDETGIPVEAINELGVSQEGLNLALEEDRHKFLERIAEFIKEVYDTLMTAFIALYRRIESSVDIISETLDEMINSLENSPHEHFYNYLTEEEIQKVYHYFGTLTRIENNIDTNDELCKLLLRAGQTISTPKLTQPMTNVIQTMLPRINIENIKFSSDVISRSGKGGIGVNNELNAYFYKNLPENVKDVTSKDSVIVVEFYGNRCAGMISRPTAFNYVKGSVNYSTKVTAFRELPSRTVLLNVLKMVKGLCVRLEGFKSLVDNDMDAGKKIVHNFNKVDRVIDDGVVDTTIFNKNMAIVKEFASAIPKIGNANLANYYLSIKNITHYGELCRSHMK